MRTNTTISREEEQAPIDINDILTICKEYHKLGWNIQSQIDVLMEIGIEQSIKKKIIKPAALPHIKEFLKQIVGSPYLGDAREQAEECILMIELFEDKHPQLLMTVFN